MSDELDDLVARLRDHIPGCNDETAVLMTIGADAITSLRADLAAAQARVGELAMQSLADLGQAQEAYEAQKKAEAERDAALTVQGAAKVLLAAWADASQKRQHLRTRQEATLTHIIGIDALRALAVDTP